MKGSAEVVAFLNEYLSIELTGHKQYLLHSSVCRNWGYHALADKQKEYSEEETAHAFAVAARLLFLEGTPAMADARKIDVRTSVGEQLALDRDLVSHAVARLREAVACAAKHDDGASRELFERMLVDEERHLRWLEAQLVQIRDVGLAIYLASQIRAS